MLPQRNFLNFTWLIKLRWSSIVGQIATMAGVQWLFDIALPIGPLAVLIAIEVLSNFVAMWWSRRTEAIREWHLALVMALDVLLLTGLLYWTGGPFNPFSFLYLVNISLAAVVLQAQWTWALVAMSCGSFGLLFLDFRELPLEHLEPGDQAGILQKGMWVALGVAAAFIVHFLLRVTGDLAAHESELGRARELASRQERLTSLATMAAGAAHELSTPLGTIAVVAKELERNLASRGEQGAAIEDLQLIRDQVARCRLILDQMGAGTGKSAELSLEDVTVAELAREATTGIRAQPQVKLAIDPSIANVPLRLPTRAVAQALRSIVTNAQDASPSDGAVSLEADATADTVHLRIVDGGSGIEPALLRRIGEPFFTTKAPGSGMGLGVFLSRAIVEKLGGKLQIDSKQGIGTTVEVVLPRRAELGPDGEGSAINEIG